MSKVVHRGVAEALTALEQTGWAVNWMKSAASIELDRIVKDVQITAGMAFMSPQDWACCVCTLYVPDPVGAFDEKFLEALRKKLTRCPCPLYKVEYNRSRHVVIFEWTIEYISPLTALRDKDEFLRDVELFWAEDISVPLTCALILSDSWVRPPRAKGKEGSYLPPELIADLCASDLFHNNALRTIYDPVHDA